MIPSIRTESDAQNYVPDDSMIFDFLETVDIGLSRDYVRELEVVIKDQDFSDIAVRDTAYGLMAELEAQDDALGAVSNWLAEFELFLNANGQSMDTMDSTTFYGELQSFGNGTSWETEIVYNDPLSPMLVESTRFKLNARMITRFSENWVEYMAWNGIFDGHFPVDDAGYVFNGEFPLGYFMNIILSLTASNMVFAGIGVFSVLMLFVDLRLALFLLLVVSMIDVHLMGWMWAFDIAMDATAYVECVMAVGLTVDYVIHITHSIAEAQPQGDVSKMSSDDIYSSKLEVALNTMGVSVWSVLSEFSMFIDCIFNLCRFLMSFHPSTARAH